MGVHERRRLVLATAVTVIALPAIWLMDRDDPSSIPPAAAIGLPEPAADAGEPETSLVPQVPVFLDNTVVLQQPAVIDIAVPDTVSPNERTVKLTFKDYSSFGDPQLELCTLPGAPSKARITLTNIDNGQRVECTNNLGMSIPVGAEMAIDINLYVQIADLVEAPVPVRASW
jgi:hypothetical protein